VQESIDGIAPYVMNADVSDAGTKVVAVDFDGVINSYTSGWQGPTETDEPVLSAAESLQTLFNRGYKVIIFSTRANTEEGIETIREYLRKHTENNELADTIEITAQKPIADVYIDDRAVPFTGDWRETLKQIEEFKPWTELGKSLTWSGFPLQGRTKIHGMDISIENKKGSVRSGTSKDGHDWSIKMNYDYGYIRGTVGKDKDHIDCYLGPDPESGRVFVVHQNDPVTGKYDEDKIMLGFDSEGEARKAYARQYDRPGFLGSIDAMDIETFKEKVFKKKNKGKRIAKALFTENELRNNAKFAHEVYKFFKDENGNINLHKTNRLAELPGFPEGLDLENCELVRIDPDKIYFAGGGDWQQMVNFAVELKNGKLHITNKFEDVSGQDAEQRKRMKAALEDVGRKLGAA
jgi:hypothetical protein